MARMSPDILLFGDGEIPVYMREVPGQLDEKGCRRFDCTRDLLSTDGKCWPYGRESDGCVLFPAGIAHTYNRQTVSTPGNG